MNIPKLEKVKVRDIKYKIGDKKYGYDVLPIEERKKVLLLSDDMRMFSGIANVSKQLVLGTAHRYNYVQLGAAIKHPEFGKVIDISDDVSNLASISDSSVKIYANNGYGNQQIVRDLINRENPDIIVHFTDPRQWLWLYEMEHEVRQIIPLAYLNIWDSIPDPQYNETFYASCDLLMSISKQTYGINKRVLERFGENPIDVDDVKDDSEFTNILSYVPHGIDNELFKRYDENNKDYKDYKSKITEKFPNKKFTILWNNRNINRKKPGDVILAYRTFCEINDVKSEDCLLIMHTAVVDGNGTNLQEVADALCPDYDILFIEQKTPPPVMPFLYNLADVTINIASNEGFGLATAESIMCETPIIVNVTGGLQDQCGFRDDNGNLLTVKDYTGNWASNHDGRYTDHGEWVVPVYPTNRSLNGSPPTPYISDDRCSFEDVALALHKVYNLKPSKRQKMGKTGREYFMSKESKLNVGDMCTEYIKSIDTTIENVETRKRFSMYKIDSNGDTRSVNMLNYDLG
jgi:glycosyltransferase involved in cell wall biosynthesis